MPKLLDKLDHAQPFSNPDEWGLKRWILFHGDRLYVAGVLIILTFLGLLLVGWFRPVEYRYLLAETGMVQAVFNTILGGVILLVSIVVAVAAVGVSQELTTIGEQTDRVDDALLFPQKRVNF